MLIPISETHFVLTFVSCIVKPYIKSRKQKTGGSVKNTKAEYVGR